MTTVPTMTTTDETTAPATVGDPTSPVHPALHFDASRASIGVWDDRGVFHLVTAGPDERAALVTPERVEAPTRTRGARGATTPLNYTAYGRPLYPAPVDYAPLRGRWDPTDRDAFCTTALRRDYTVAFMGGVRALL